MNSQKNLRTSDRLSLQIPVKITRESESLANRSFFISSLTQLSPEGAFVTTSANYQTGSLVAMDFEIPTQNRQKRSIHTVGKVIWRGSGNPEMGVGVHFLVMAQEEKELIRDFMQKQVRV